MKKILVPIDFSDQSDYVIDFALQLARKHKSQVLLYHVVDFPVMTNISFDLTGHKSKEIMLKDLQSQAMERLEAWMKGKRTTGFNLKYEVGIGEPADEIAMYATKNKADLMVVSAHIDLELTSHILSTNFDRVIHQVQCPVMILRGPTKLTELKKVLFANDFKGDPKVLSRQAKFLTNLFKAKFSMVKINTPLEFSSDVVFQTEVEQLKKTVPFSQFDFDLFNHFDIAEGLLYAATARDSDLIVIGSKRRSLLRRLVVGEDLAESVMDHSTCPMLIFND